MNQALIIGSATSISKHESLYGQKLLLAIPISADKTKAEGDPIVVFDNLGAGIGNVVLISSDGSYTGGNIIGTRITPARWGVIGIIDHKQEEQVL